jgi:hypothetical protein
LPAARGVGDDLVTAASDWYGSPTAIPPTTDPPAPYCTALRWTWLSRPVAGAPAQVQVARLDVRTWWHRAGRNGGLTIAQCGPDQDDVTTGLANILDFGAVYSSTVVRWQGATP